jgi:hypothetical protein
VRTEYGYDGDGRLTSVAQYLNFGKPNQQALVTQYGYDEVGNRRVAQPFVLSLCSNSIVGVPRPCVLCKGGYHEPLH